MLDGGKEGYFYRINSGANNITALNQVSEDDFTDDPRQLYAGVNYNTLITYGSETFESNSHTYGFNIDDVLTPFASNLYGGGDTWLYFWLFTSPDGTTSHPDAKKVAKVMFLVTGGFYENIYRVYDYDPVTQVQTARQDLTTYYYGPYASGIGGTFTFTTNSIIFTHDAMGYGLDNVTANLGQDIPENCFITCFGQSYGTYPEGDVAESSLYRSTSTSNLPDHPPAPDPLDGPLPDHPADPGPLPYVQYETPTFEDGTSLAVQGTTTSVVLTKPVGVVAGELLVILCANEDSTDNPSFSLLNPTTTWIKGFEYGTSVVDVKVGMFYRIADGTESTQETVDWNATGADYGGGWYLKFSGVDSLNPIQLGTGTEVSSATQISTSMTTNQNKALVVAVGAFDGADASSYMSNWLGVFNNPSNVITTDGGGNGVKAKLANMYMDNAGETGDCIFTADISDGQVAGIFAINGAETFDKVTIVPRIDYRTFNYFNTLNRLDYRSWGKTIVVNTLSYNLLAMVAKTLEALYNLNADPYYFSILKNLYNKYNFKNIIQESEYNKYDLFGQNVTQVILNKLELIEVGLVVQYTIRPKTQIVQILNYRIPKRRPYITKSFETIVPTWPDYLDGELQFWEPQQLEYLGSYQGDNQELSEIFIGEAQLKLSYEFEDVPNSQVLHNGPASLNDFVIDRDLIYQKHGNVAIIKVNENYFCYVIQGSESYGEILYKPAELVVGPYESLNAETNFVTFFPLNRQFDLLSFTNSTISTGENQTGDWPDYYSNELPEFSFIDVPTGGGGDVTIQPEDLILASTLFNILQGGENIYYEGLTGFYYFETKPTEPFTASPLISLADAINGDYSTDVTLVALSFIPDTWKLNGSAITIASNTIIFHPSARINRVPPTLIKTYENAYVIPTTTSETQITLNREEYKLAGYIIINGEDKWVTLTWIAVNTYSIDSISSIVDLTKLATKELVINKSFNKYL